MWGVAAFLLYALECIPLRGFWDHNVQATCVNSRGELIGTSTANIITDIAILCLPIRQVLQLQMPAHLKVAVCGVFLLGSL